MSSFQEKSAAQFSSYNPWVVSVGPGSSRRPAPARAVRHETSATAIVLRTLRRIRSALQRSPE